MNLKRKMLAGAALLVILLLVLTNTSALAQDYYFSVDELTVDVFVNEDGSVSLEYLFVFNNAPGAHTIDFVDVGLPTDNFSASGIVADVNGIPVDVSTSEYQGDGSGVAVVLNAQAIPPGGRGSVHIAIPHIDSWLRTDSRDPNYASLEFSPTWFGRKFVQGDTNTTVTFHLPPGVQVEEPRWHEAPAGFSVEPVTGIDDQGRITYTWTNTQAEAYQRYEFGASFPSQYVPAGIVVKPTASESLGLDSALLNNCVCISAVALVFWGIISSASRSANRRKLQYLPPKIAIEGMGIKRGLTAVEAAILMEQPLDKVLTMVLFGLVKKGAAQVTKQDPLTIEAITPAPADLNDYERDFLAAFQKAPREQRAALQNISTDLVKNVESKMKGFSRRETVAYYTDIIERAWKQVEAGQTPEIKMEAFDKYMEWTMMDRDYDDRTRRVFTGPVFVPTWWSRYDPTFRPASTGGGAKPLAAPASSSSPGGGFALPNLPGSAFAASMVHGVENFSSNVIGNVTEFTSAITNRTNPPPPPSTTRSSGRSGGGCACACACAGCACACAGGGR